MSNDMLFPLYTCKIQIFNMAVDLSLLLFQLKTYNPVYEMPCGGWDVGLLGILREHALVKQYPFTGRFVSDCFSRPVPEPLLTFMDVLLQGPKVNIEGPQKYDAGMDQGSKVACGICQPIIYNMVKYTSSSDTSY